MERSGTVLPGPSSLHAKAPAVQVKGLPGIGRWVRSHDRTCRGRARNRALSGYRYDLPKGVSFGLLLMLYRLSSLVICALNPVEIRSRTGRSVVAQGLQT